jgi:hypothetical protein
MILKKGLSGRDKAEVLGKELETLKASRRDFEGTWEEAQRFVSTTVLRFGDDTDTSDQKYITPRRITSRPANFLQTLVSGVSGYSINPNILWLKLGLDDPKLEGQYGVKDWLEGAEGALYREYNRGNLYSQIPKLIESAATFGHGAMLIDEDVVNGKIRCVTMNPTEIYLDTNEYDEVDTVFREFHLTIENAAAYFGLDHLAREIQDNWGNDETGLNKPIRICHAVYKNKKNDGGNLVSQGFMYASVFIDLDHDHVIREGGYENFPYAVFTWEKTMGKKYGIGPAICAVNDIRLLHKAEESRLKVAQLSAEPPMNIPQKLQGTEQPGNAGRAVSGVPGQLPPPGGRRRRRRLFRRGGGVR